jgi:fructose-bisphosphate aldolase, class II
MPLTNMTDMLNHAYRHGYAVGAFNVSSFDFLEGVLTAAENCRAPVVLNLPETHAAHYNFDMLMAAALAGARRSAIPVAICLDHGSSLSAAVNGIKAGCNAVMIDASALPLDENLRCTKEVVDMAHACGVTVEGELGYVPWVAGDGEEKPPEDIAYTLPAEAKAYAERSGIDCLAVSIGTVHGLLRGTPRLDITRLVKISEAVGIPLVIHGGTGLGDDQFRKLIAHGVAKINYYTALADVAGASIRTQLQSHPHGSYPQLTAGVRDAIGAQIERMIRLWGSGGRAAEVLQQCRPWQEVEQIALYNMPDKMAETEVTAIMQQGMATLGRIPGVRKVRAGKSRQPDGHDHYCWIIRFASQEAADHYRTHPSYLRFIDKSLRPVLPDLLTVDYITAE